MTLEQIKNRNRGGNGTMKREILFRGFHECENGTQIKEYSGEWVFGYFWTNEAGNCFIKVIRDLNGNFVGNPTTNDYEVIPKTVGMWTGLTDKNGKKIFEGDTVDFEYDFAGLSRGFIIWNEDEARFEIDEDGCCAQFYETRQMEVIGTIFDEEGGNG